MNKCDSFIEAITPIFMNNGGDKVILHGRHGTDLSSVNVLMTVEDSECVVNSYAEVAIEAIKNGILGSVNVRKKSEFPSGLEDMKKFFIDHPDRTIKPYAKNDENELAHISA